ncbi:hypothetical protein [Streptomyces sp. NPDC048516]|uniref:hypothetical protein n=1 Tax=Streptomyces sp. NPDC048516 TaxID=3365565 RepID=UPI00371D3D61
MAEAGIFIGATGAWLATGSMVAPHMAEPCEAAQCEFAGLHREGARLVCCSDAGAGPRKPHGVFPYRIIHFGSLSLINTEAGTTTLPGSGESARPTWPAPTPA